MAASMSSTMSKCFEELVKVIENSSMHFIQQIETSALRLLIRAAYTAEECVLVVSYVWVRSISHCLIPLRPLLAIL